MLRRIVQAAIRGPRVIQEDTESERRVPRADTDSRPGIRPLSLLAEHAVPMQLGTGNSSRLIVAMDGEPAGQFGQVDGQVMALMILCRKLCNPVYALAQILKGLLAQYQQKEPELDRRGARIGLD